MKHENTKIMKHENKLYLYFCVFVFLCFCVLTFSKAAHSPNALARTSPDVIAIRVIPNHQHYSPQRWYKEQGFAGSPQSLTINGYEAIKEGRTVYVNAANISDKGTPDPGDDILYTNIYLMSYNQDADSDTIAIVNQLLQHWGFNTNLDDSGYCQNSVRDDINCPTEDCPTGYHCDTSDNKCKIVCFTDPECPTGDWCDSAKAKVTRDTKRLEDLAEMKIALKAYKNKHNRYPELSSGSYLPHKTISTWPSWQQALANELSIILPADPINRLGECSGYDETTCWDEQNKEFADSDTDDPELNLPADSRSYVYTAAANGASATICAVMESGLVNTIAEGACLGSESREHAVSAENHAPQFTGANLPIGYSGEPYQGFVSAVDPDNDELTWTFNIISCPLWNNLRMENTAVANQKTVLADNAGQAGNCGISITINDSRGGVISQNYTITVENGNVPIIQPIANQTITIGYDLSFTVLAEEADNQYPLTFIFSGKPNGFNSTGSLDTNQHDLNVSGTIIDQTKTYSVSVIAYDIYNGASDPVDFTVTEENNPPVINPALADDATEACASYSYSITANDPDSHDIDYSSTPLPTGLALNKIDANNAEIIGIPTVPGNSLITINIADEHIANTIAPYTATDSDSFTLTITDEVFTITAPADDSFYVIDTSAVPYASLHHRVDNGYNISYFGTVNRSNNPSYVISWDKSINALGPGTGTGLLFNDIPDNGPLIASADIHVTASDDNNDPGTYDITIWATNNCGIDSANTETFTLEVLKNGWCGDTAVQNIANGDTDDFEECDDGPPENLDGQTCQIRGYDYGILACNNCLFDESDCCSIDCAGIECGMDITGCGDCPNLCGLNTWCNSGSCDCLAGWSACDGSAADADGCECDVSGSNVCWGGACCPPATCAANLCDIHDDGCGGTIDCGICGAGYACDSDGLCVQKATGGTITSSGGYIIHTFTSSGTFTVNIAMNVQVFVVGGGGGGDGGGAFVYDHGGAGGTVRTNASMFVAAESYAVVVGAGGAGLGWEGDGGAGGSSSFNSLVATGGGGGVVRPNGHGGNNADYSGVVASYPSGGGGAGAGGNGGQGGVCGGGVGVHSSISGADIGYGGGGRGINGPGIATDGGGSNSAGVNGRGGGGGTLLHMGQKGGSGIVIVRYPA